jgi:hypothetical protein
MNERSEKIQVDQLILDVKHISTHILHKEGVSWLR